MKGNCKKYKNKIFATSTKYLQPKNKILVHKKKIENDNLDSDAVFICHDEKVINIVLFNDLIFDCGSKGEDEPILMTLLKQDNYFSCTKPDMIPCMEGHSKCYHLKDICTYKLILHKYLVPCRNGGHLENCKDFECNLLFKCIGSYCIPWSYVCDGKWDCPQGGDELYNPICTNTEACRHMYKCRNILQCVHLGNVCDGNVDCPFGDDENPCHIHRIKCPFGCNCMLSAIDCRFTSDMIFDTLTSFPFLSVYISNSKISSLKKFPSKLYYAIVVKLPRNCLKDICYILPLRDCLLFDLGYNCLKRILKFCFASFWLLQSLSINDNQITVIETNSFHNISQLKFLNLSNNSLHILPDAVFITSSLFKLFYILNVSFTFASSHTFIKITADVIITNDYHSCCILSKESVCLAYKPWYLSCSDILPKDNMKIFYKSVSGTVILLNTISISILILFIKQNKAFLFTFISVNLTDILCGFYLGCIWVADEIYKDGFIVREELWRSGPVCFVAFGLLLWFTILSQLVLNFLSLSQLMVVIHPIATRFKETQFVLKSILSFYILSFLVTILTTLSFKFTYESIPMSLCLPFIDPANSIFMIKVLTWSVIVTQTVSSIALLVLHILLVEGLKESKTWRRNSEFNDNSNTALIVQLICITSSNILCWFPVNALYMAAMFLSTYPIDLVIWTTVICIPLNSIINPLIFIIASIKKCAKLMEKG